MSENRTPQLAAVMITGMTISLIVMSLRFWTRIKIVHKVGLDDWVALLSLTMLVIAFSLLGTAAVYGLGKHAATLPPAHITYAMKMVWIAFQFTPTAEATGKIAVAIMLMRITTSQNWKRFFLLLIFLNIAINIGLMFSILMSCWPVQMLWDPSLPGHCNIHERNAMIYVQAVAAAGSDLVLGIAPIILLWNVQTSKKTKWLLCGLLSIGFFTACAGIIRLAYTFETYDAETSRDPTWGLMNFILWKCVELDLSVIVGCLPTLRPLFDSHTWSRISTPRRGYTDDSHKKQTEGSESDRKEIMQHSVKRSASFPAPSERSV